MPINLRIISENRKQLGDAGSKKFVACGGTIGRSLDNDWALPDPHRYVSGRHALIDFQGGAYYIVDTSRNGVYVNGADTPVGRGHPQRLFDGDQLRIGEYEILIEVTPGDEDIADDGMRDSVVRAQLVEEDESLELALMDEKRMTEDESISAHLISDTPSEPRAPEFDTASTPASTPDHDAMDAVRCLAEAAGMKPEDLAGRPAEEVLRAAGSLLRDLIGGMMELLHDRAQFKEHFRLPQTIIRAEPNNPLKFSAGTADALRFLLGDSSDSYLTPREAVRHVVTDIKQHEKAVVGAMRQALEDYLERFDPDELRSQYDRGLKRGALLASANKLKYWELYEESYQVLTQHQEGQMPMEFRKDFAQAYEQQVTQLRRNNASES